MPKNFEILKQEQRGEKQIVTTQIPWDAPDEIDPQAKAQILCVLTQEELDQMQQEQGE